MQVKGRACGISEAKINKGFSFFTQIRGLIQAGDELGGQIGSRIKGLGGLTIGDYLCVLLLFVFGMNYLTLYKSLAFWLSEEIKLILFNNESVIAFSFG